MARAGGALAGIVVVAVIGNAALTALHSPARASAKQPVRLLASTTTSTVRQQGKPVADVTPVSPAPLKSPGGTTPKTGSSQPSSSTRALASPQPHGMTLKVPVGRSGLRDSMYVERDADSAVVHFDTEMGRTRRRDKFETTVRVTLPILYGASADSMLAGLPEGAITGNRDLVSEVAVRGVRLSAPGGGTLELWPVTRPGRDGPLVVGYRVRATP
jgi:hypothetical protein